jgi:8-oxo-dGTP pyrophosphatase MutT (NUDIX family)
MDKSHLGVYALIIRAKHIVVIKKIRGPYSGTLDLPGGTPEFGESHLETVRRETKEEVGYDYAFQKTDFLMATSFVYDYTMDGLSHRLHHHAIVYKAEVDLTLVEGGGGDGIDSGGSSWVSRDGYNLSPLARHVISLLDDRNG